MQRHILQHKYLAFSQMHNLARADLEEEEVEMLALLEVALEDKDVDI